MRKIVVWGICFLAITALIPITAGIKYTDKEVSTVKAQKNVPLPLEYNISDEETEHIICNVMEYITEDSCTEARKAVLALCKNNYLYCKSNGLSPDENHISKYSDDFFAELCSLYEELDCTITYQGDTVYIPLTNSSGEHTSTSDEYPYMVSVASPWDVFSREYNADRDYPCGVSVYGLIHLCSEGSSYTDALRWYLPKFSIISS